MQYWCAALERTTIGRMADNIMPQIPGEYLSPSRYWMPSQTTPDATHEVQCVLPRFGAVRITYQRMTHKHGRFRRWFWTPVCAEVDSTRCSSASVAADGS